MPSARPGSRRFTRMTPATLQRVLNLWPPYLGAGIRVDEIAPDWSTATVSLHQRWYNRNIRGSHFGGSLSAMSDPFFALLVMHRLPDDYSVWDRSGAIEFVAPGRGRVWARFEVTERDMAQIVAMTDGGDKHLHLFKADIRDGNDMVVARVERIVYVRKARSSEEPRGDPKRPETTPGSDQRGVNHR